MPKQKTYLSFKGQKKNTKTCSFYYKTAKISKIYGISWDTTLNNKSETGQIQTSDSILWSSTRFSNFKSYC